MYLFFKEEFDLPISQVFPYFKTPADWAKLYGTVKPTKNFKNNWYAIPLKMCPFPLVARNVFFDDEVKVRWEFGGFWRGIGEVNFFTKNGKTVVEGYEYISPYGLWLLASFVEKHFMEKQFQNIWDLGWKRIRKNEM